MPRWLKRTLVALGALVVVAGAALVYLVSRDTTTPVEVSEAVDRYRDSTTTSPSSPAGDGAEPAGPDTGVYVYATEGSEHVDILGGATHDYPASTTVTIERTACGLRQRWTPIEERRDDEDLCWTEDGLERRTLRTHHEFFDIDDDETFRCEAGYLLVPTDARPGDDWTTTCVGGDTRLTGRGEVVGFETRDVSGTTVDTVHVRIEELASGGNDGPSSDDYWFRRSDGLLIERTSSVLTSSDSPVGTATYEERFTLRLSSLEPRT